MKRKKELLIFDLGVYITEKMFKKMRLKEISFIETEEKICPLCSNIKGNVYDLYDCSKVECGKCKIKWIPDQLYFLLTFKNKNEK